MTAMWAILGSLVTLLGAGVTAWFTARTSARATTVTARIDEKEADTDRYDKLNRALEVRLERVEAQDAQKGEQIAELQATVEAQGERIKQLEQERAQDRSMIRHLIVYARALIAYANTLRDALLALGQPVEPVPEPPVDLGGATP